jgi:hypothetical protein
MNINVYWRRSTPSHQVWRVQMSRRCCVIGIEGAVVASNFWPEKLLIS